VRFRNSYFFRTFTFSHICSFKKPIVRLHFLSHFWKVWKKCDRTIALFKRATKKCDPTIALFKRATKKCDCTITLFKRVTKKCDCTIALFKKANVRKCAKKCEFSNVQIAQQAGLGNHPFWNVRLPFFHTFLHIHPFQKSNCAIALSKVRKKVWFQNSQFFRTFLHIRSFRKSDCVIALFCTFSIATKSAIAHSHIFKEWKYAMCECAIAQPWKVGTTRYWTVLANHRKDTVHGQQ